MLTMLWLGGALLMLVALCHVPFFTSAQLRAIRQGWVGLEARGPVPALHRLRYHAAQGKALLVAVLFFAVGASYLYLVGLHLGVLRPWP